MFSPQIHIQKYIQQKLVQNRKTVQIFAVFILIVGALAFNVWPSFAATGINKQISFQGKVVNNNGTNVSNGNYDFVFKLYTASSGGSPVWTETWNSGTAQVTVTDGIFQVNLGTHTSLPGSVDFNTDNIYLGIEFNGDGEMSPRVHFTAAPYAMNARTVGGLTVTDTTGTLTIPNGETISFGGSFTTSASNDVTLTTSGTTNVTLPTTGTLATLAGSEVLTNKTIGSTGLIFSGATTDITTTAGEDLTLNSGTTGTINIGTDASAETINIGNTGAAVKTIAIGNNSQANTITIGDASATSVSITDNNWSIGTGGAASFTALSSSGTITFSSLNNAGAVLFTNSSGVVTQDTTNFIWDDSNDRLGIGDATPDAALDFDFSSTNGTAGTEYGGYFTLSDTGAVSSSTDTTYGLRVDTTRTGATGGILNTYGTYTNLTNTFASGVGTANGYGQYTAVTGSTTGSTTLYGEYVTVAAASDTTYGNYVDFTLSAGNGGSAYYTTGTNTSTGAYYGYRALLTQNNAANTGFLFDGTLTLTAGAGRGSNITVNNADTTAINGVYGNKVTLSDTGVVTTGTDTGYGSSITVTRTGATGGTIDTYGQHIVLSTDDASGGASTAYGQYIDTGVSGSTNADTIYGQYITTEANAGTAYGVYVDVGTQTGTEYSGIFLNGNLGIGDTTPDNPLEITSTATQIRLSYTDTSVDATIGVDSNEYLLLAAGTTSEINRVQIGAGGGGNSTPDFFGLDVKSDTGDPAGGFEGAMYYNTSDNVFRCYQNTGWTNCIGSGGSSDLQTTYGTDADGSDATISLTTADDSLIFTNPTSSGTDSAFLLSLNQQHTTGAVSVLDITQASNAANAVNLTANSIDAETGLAITANGLTSGKGISVASSAAAFTGNLINLTLSGSNASNTGSLLAVDNTGTSNANTSLYIKHYATGTNNLAFRVDDVSGDTSPFVIDGGGNVGIGDATPDAILDVNLTSTSATAGTEYGATITTSDTGVVTTGSDLTYGLYASTTRTGSTGDDVTAYGIYSQIAGDSGGAGNTSSYGMYVNSTTPADTVVGYYGAINSSETGGTTMGYGISLNDGGGAAATTYGSSISLIDNAGLSSGNDKNYGNYVSIDHRGSTGGTIETYGAYTLLTTDNAGAGTSTAYGAYIDTNVADVTNADTVYGQYITTEANASTTAYGLYVDVGAQAGTEYSGIFMNGNFGVGTATPSALFSVGSSSQFQVNSSGTIAAVVGITSTGAIAANAGITFDNSTDTVGAHTLSGTIDANTNILTNIGNTGTDFVASTGALTLAGVLTANGGVALAGSQSFTASALAYMDLGSITHSTTAVQGLRLPQAASASPSSPTSGEGYLAWDAAGNQLIYYTGSAWSTITGGSGYATVQEEGSSLTQRTTLNFIGSGITCADNASKTECTLSGGGGEDLQTTYGLDADGSNVTISLTAADDGLVFTNPTSGGNDLSTFLLSLTQQHTTAGIVVLDMVQSSNAANGANLTADAIDGETGLAITTNGLTSGKGISITSSATAFTGNLADISLTGSNTSNTGNVLAVSNTGTANANTSLFVDHRATGTGNLAVRVDDQSGDTTPFVIDGSGNVGIQTSAPSVALQVGSAANRQDSWFYGDVTKKGMVDKNVLANINDVFIYDTTRDPDGGTWTRSVSAQNLSWYTETVDNTAGSCVLASDDRCGQAAFPRKAILTVTPEALYIFDADDNSMWMKFSQTGTYAFGADTNNNPSSVFALNGVIYVGTNGASSTGLYAIDFINDRLYRYNTTDRNLGDKNIANRNSTVTYNVESKTALKFIGAGSVQVNDVHGAIIYGGSSILTNGGPLNGATFICAATDDGIQVVSLTTQKTTPYGDANVTDQYSACFVTRRARMYGINVTKQELNRWGNPATSNNNIDTDQVASATGVTTPYKIWDESATVGNAPNLFATAQTINVKPDTLEVVERSSLADEKADLIYVGHGGGMTEIHDQDTNASPTLGWSKFYSTTRETALMTGNQEGMFLLNEAAGATTASDQTVRNSVLAVKGGVTFGVNGVHGTGATFNNSTGYLCSDANADAACDTDADFNVAAISFTIHGWFRHSTTAPASGTDTLVDKRYPAAGAALGIGYTVEMNTSGQMIFGIQDTAATAGYDDSVTSTISFADGQWHHFAAVNTDTGLCLYIDGKLTVACDASLTGTGTLDASAVMTIGAACGATAACGAPLNFWDGDIDDVYFSGNGATTSSNLSQTQVRKLYMEGRSALSRASTSFTDATTATSTTLGDSTAVWVPNSFAGELVEITGGTGVGQTRRVVSNTATVLTVSPAFTSVPDTTSDFEVMPEQLYGSTNTVTAIGLTDNTFLGDSRRVYVGTNDGSDGGGVTLFGGNGVTYATDVYHADAGKSDDTSGTWSGTDYDDIQAIGTNGTSVTIGSLAHMWTETDELDFQVTLDTLANRINSIRGELIVDGITGTSHEVGIQGGADLAENYYSDTPLEAGTVVALDTKRSTYVNQTAGVYQRDMLGVVATSPGMVLGDPQNNGYPIALVGRVPVKVTNENGPIYAGDRLTSATRSGYAMRATQAGRVLGVALNDASDWVVCDGEDPADMNAKLCTTVLVFVNLTDYAGQPVELAMAEHDQSLGSDGLSSQTMLDGKEQGLLPDEGSASVRLATSVPTKQEKILTFLKEMRGQEAGNPASEIFTGRVAASTEVITPKLFADEIVAKSIKADSIEGLQIWTNQLLSLEAKYAGLAADNATEHTSDETVSQNQISLLQALKALSLETLSVSLDTTLLGKLSVGGGITVAGNSSFQGDTTFEKLASFLNATLFKGKVAFETTPTFNHDTAGFAVVERGAHKVKVEFETPYMVQPVVSVALTNDRSILLNDKADSELKADLKEVEKDFVDAVFDTDLRFIVTDKNKDGFTILLNHDAPRDLQFSWVAVAVDKAKTFASGKTEDGNNQPQEEPLPVLSSPTAASPEVTPLPEPITPPIEETPTPVSVTTEETVITPSESEAI